MKPDESSKLYNQTAQQPHLLTKACSSVCPEGFGKLYQMASLKSAPTKGSRHWFTHPESLPLGVIQRANLKESNKCKTTKQQGEI